MKHIIIYMLLVVSLASLFAGCSSTRKIASEQTQQHSTTSVDAQQQTQTSKNDMLAVRTQETDLTNAVIEFTKIEYVDGTSVATTSEADVQHDTSKMRDRQPTEPPNANKNVKSVTSGHVTLNNDKKIQTEASIISNEVIQSNTSVKSQEDTDAKTEAKVTEKGKHDIFHYLGLFFFFMLICGLLYVFCYFKYRNK